MKNYSKYHFQFLNHLRNSFQYVGCVLNGCGRNCLLVPGKHLIWAGIFKQSMGARNRGGIGLSYRPARLHRLDGIHSLESIPGLHKRLKLRALVNYLLTKRSAYYSTCHFFMTHTMLALQQAAYMSFSLVLLCSQFLFWNFSEGISVNNMRIV